MGRTRVRRRHNRQTFDAREQVRSTSRPSLDQLSRRRAADQSLGQPVPPMDSDRVNNTKSQGQLRRRPVPWRRRRVILGPRSSVPPTASTAGRPPASASQTAAAPTRQVAVNVIAAICGPLPPSRPWSDNRWTGFGLLQPALRLRVSQRLSKVTSSHDHHTAAC